jgi:hypothetical protein
VRVSESCAARIDDVPMRTKDAMRAATLAGLLATVGLQGPCAPVGAADEGGARTYTIVDTGQTRCYDNTHEIAAPAEGRPFYGQDGQYNGPQPAYRDNGDGTVSDLNTGLMWQKDPGKKVTWEQAVAGPATCTLAGHTDWRLPTIKELYSLIDFSGVTGPSAAESRPYIDTRYFVFRYGDPSAGERFIDAQYCSSTEYVSTTMNGSATVFGVNFADGRIKGYPKRRPGPGGRPMMFFCRYVRGNPAYGRNAFHDNGDGTITDEATGLTWMQRDSGAFGVGDGSDGRLNWQQALEWAEGLAFAGYTDWRLPNAKELQSIVDYTRSPDTTNSAAIAAVFECTPIVAEDGRRDYGFYWTSTTHLDGPWPGAAACYVCFGRAYGFMFGRWLDVHGAGAQRSDPKAGNPLAFPFGRGPQGDAIRIYNLVRCVRGGLTDR